MELINFSIEVLQSNDFSDSVDVLRIYVPMYYVCTTHWQD